MNLLHFLKPKEKKQFISETALLTNKEKHSRLSIETLVRLREINVEEEDTFKIDFLFHARSQESSLSLVNQLHALHYTTAVTESVNFILVKGQTTPLKMMHEVLKKWAVDMCELGYAHACHFEEWKISK